MSVAIAEDADNRTQARGCDEARTQARARERRQDRPRARRCGHYVDTKKRRRTEADRLFERWERTRVLCKTRSTK